MSSSVVVARRGSRTAVVTAIATAILVACGPSPSLSVEIGDAAIVIVAGGAAITEVTITRGGGASADATLDATGAPDWVTVTFAPETLAGSSSTSTMTISTDGESPDVDAASFTLTVTAVAGGLNASDDATVQVELLTVRGSVVDILRQPVTGQGVTIDGGAPVVVDADGEFELSGVVIPYDLVLYDLGMTWAHVYEDLTATDLQLMTATTAGTSSSTTVSGDLSAPVGANQLGFVCVEGVDKVIMGTCDTIGVGATAYSVTASWREGLAASARVRAWIVDVGAGGEATAYPLQGQTALNLANGVAALADVSLQPGPGAVEVDFTVTPPPGYPLGSVIVRYQYGEHASISFPLGTMSDSFTGVLPDYPGARVTLLGTATSGSGVVYAWETEDVAAGAVDLVMPEHVTQIAPANGAVNVNPSTPFRVDNPSGTPPTYYFAGPMIYLVTTSENEINLPDLTDIGMPFAAATGYIWQVVVTPHLTTVDAVATQGWYPLGDLQIMLNGGPPVQPSSLQVANARNFTTQ